MSIWESYMRRLDLSWGAVVRKEVTARQKCRQAQVRRRLCVKHERQPFTFILTLSLFLRSLRPQHSHPPNPLQYRLRAHSHLGQTCLTDMFMGYTYPQTTRRAYLVPSAQPAPLRLTSYDYRPHSRVAAPFPIPFTARPLVFLVRH